MDLLFLQKLHLLFSLIAQKIEVFSFDDNEL